MSNTIHINYLPFRREHFFGLTVHLLSKINESNKKKLEFNILTCGDLKRWHHHKDTLEQNNIKTNIVNIGTNNYMPKINYAVSTNSKYSIKLDEDTFLNHYAWDYLLENISILDNDKNLLFAPLLSNGIPTCDLFLESYLKDSPDELQKVRNEFLKVNFPNELWRVNYRALNDHTLKAKNWNSDEFYKGVKDKIKHYYQGVHPVRLGHKSHIAVNEAVWKNLDKFLQKSDYSLLNNTKKFPYFCNTFFAIRTDVYKKIVHDKSLFRDPFDEVPVNIYRNKHDLNFVFVNNSYGIHILYPMSAGMASIENEYFERLRKHIIK